MAENAALAGDKSLLALLERRLLHTVPPDANTPCGFAGVRVEEFPAIQPFLPVTKIPAAVLIPVIDRPGGPHLLFTQRATHLRHHGGQISFPGGRIEANENPLDAALRETEEEIGLSREYVRVLGYLEPQIIFTGYCVSPVVGLVRPGFQLTLDASEVAGVFEAPLAHVLDPINHQARERQVGDVTFNVHDIPFGEHRIWGATAGILISLYRLLKTDL